MQRQITMQKSNAQLLQAFNHEGAWAPVRSTLLTTTTPWSSGGMWYNIDRLDLRGLLAGKENGVLFNNIVLQESGTPYQRDQDDPSEGTLIWMCDLLTTYKPSEEEISRYFRGLTEESIMPSFIRGDVNISSPTLAVEPHNPNEVVWGLWRMFDLDTTSKVTDTLYELKLSSSGYFGEGDAVVSPHVYWTRVVWGLNSKLASPAGGKGLTIPASNLVMQGTALELTVPQEITQMMRASGR